MEVWCSQAIKERLPAEPGRVFSLTCWKLFFIIKPSIIFLVIIKCSLNLNLLWLHFVEQQNLFLWAFSFSCCAALCFAKSPRNDCFLLIFRMKSKLFSIWYLLIFKNHQINLLSNPCLKKSGLYLKTDSNTQQMIIFFELFNPFYKLSEFILIKIEKIKMF